MPLDVDGDDDGDVGSDAVPDEEVLPLPPLVFVLVSPPVVVFVVRGGRGGRTTRGLRGLRGGFGGRGVRGAGGR